MRITLSDLSFWTAHNTPPTPSWWINRPLKPYRWTIPGPPREREFLDGAINGHDVTWKSNYKAHNTIELIKLGIGNHGSFTAYMEESYLSSWGNAPTKDRRHAWLVKWYQRVKRNYPLRVLISKESK